MKFGVFPIFLCSCEKVAGGRQTPHHQQPLLELPAQTQPAPATLLLPELHLHLGPSPEIPFVVSHKLLMPFSETLCCFSSLFHRSGCSFHGLSLNRIPAVTGFSPAPNTCTIICVFHKKSKDTVGPVFLLLLCKEQNRKISRVMLSCFFRPCS